MKLNSLLLLLSLALTSTSILSQNLKGNWEWKNEKYQGIAFFDSTSFHSKIFFLNSDAKVLERHYYYILDKNKLYLSEEEINADSDKKNMTVYKLKEKSESEFELTGGSSGNDIYKRSRKTFPKVNRFNNQEFYIINSKLQCLNQDGSSDIAGKCLQIAGISFYSTFEDVQKKFGKELRSQANNDNSVTFYYSIASSEKKPSIIGITIKDEKIIKIELTGYKSGDDLAFSSIRLGDFYTFVKQRLGEPAYKKEVKSPGDETWVYQPVPISIEFRLNKVTSITIEPFQLQE